MRQGKKTAVCAQILPKFQKLQHSAHSFPNHFQAPAHTGRDVQSVTHWLKPASSAFRLQFSSQVKNKHDVDFFKTICIVLCATCYMVEFDGEHRRCPTIAKEREKGRVKNDSRLDFDINVGRDHRDGLRLSLCRMRVLVGMHRAASPERRPTYGVPRIILDLDVLARSKKWLKLVLSDAKCLMTYANRPMKLPGGLYSHTYSFP